jgi:hypothetical protein
MFIPDILTPAQWRPTRGLYECGCQRLLFEVLLNALDTLQYPPLGQPKSFETTRREARLWFEAPDADVAINLRDCCDGLNLEVGKVQRAARRQARLNPGARPGARLVIS